MPELSGLGRVLIVAGIVLLGIGVLLAFGVKLLPLGKLPGDILIKRGNFTFYFPVVTSILLSIILSLVFALFRRWQSFGTTIIFQE